MVSGTHLVEKTIDSINGLTDASYTAKQLASVNLSFNVFPQKTLTWGQLFSSLLLWNSILFYYVVSINVSKIQFSLTGSSIMQPDQMSPQVYIPYFSGMKRYNHQNLYFNTKIHKIIYVLEKMQMALMVSQNHLTL